MSVASHRHATDADLEAVPPHLVAEIIAGELVTHPRPMPKHAVAAQALGAELGNPFQRGRSGPGGRIFMTEPELHLGADVVVPDIAAWRRERLPRLPETAFMESPPDWACEVVSPSTETYDRGPKRRIYAAAGGPFFWILDPRAELLETFALREGEWVLTGTFGNDDEVAAKPFEAISFPLSILWPFDRPKADETADKT